MDKRNILLIVIAAVAIGTVLLGMMCSLFGVLLKWGLILLVSGGAIWVIDYFVFDVNLADSVRDLLDGWRGNTGNLPYGDSDRKSSRCTQHNQYRD